MKQPEQDKAQLGRADLQKLLHIGVEVLSRNHLDDLLPAVALAARELIGARYAAIGILDPGHSHLTDFIYSGIPSKTAKKIGNHPTGKGLLGVLIDDPRPLRLSRLSDHPSSSGFPEHHPPMVSFLGVPVVGRSGPIGNLYLTDKEFGDFTHHDEELAVHFAAQVAVAVESARLLDKTEKLMHSQEQFYSTVNHELRNALLGVHGWADLLVRKMGEDAPRAAKEVFESAEAALELLEDLLTLNKLEAGKLEPRPRNCDLATVGREAVSSLEGIAESRSILITTAFPQELDAYTDPIRIKQVLVNLITNGLRHSPEGSSMDVSLTEAHGFVYEVENEGEIDPDMLGQIFEEFVQGDSSRERGLGLGLPLSRRIARLLGGDVTVESESGRTCFKLELPRSWNMKKP